MTECNYSSERVVPDENSPGTNYYSSAARLGSCLPCLPHTTVGLAPCPGTPAQRGDQFPSTLLFLLCLQCTTTTVRNNLDSPHGWGMDKGTGIGAQPFPGAPPKPCFLPSALLINHSVICFLKGRPKWVQLSVIPGLCVVDPRGHVIVGSNPTSSRGTAEEMKWILLLSRGYKMFSNQLVYLVSLFPFL